MYWQNGRGCWTSSWESLNLRGDYEEKNLVNRVPKKRNSEKALEKKKKT